ncbi:GIY-YIG nuclease family protein [bacterium]|nr:GIY-YIG nuclease family protein [bacterium]
MDKNELKLIYKNTHRQMGVFQIRNKANGKVLVGSSLNLAGRRNRFNFEVAQGCASTNRDMKEDWARFGAENFAFEVLEEIKPGDDPSRDYKFEVAELEKNWIEKLQPFGERGYNKEKD